MYTSGICIILQNIFSVNLFLSLLFLLWAHTEKSQIKKNPVLNRSRLSAFVGRQHLRGSSGLCSLRYDAAAILKSSASPLRETRDLCVRVCCRYVFSHFTWHTGFCPQFRPTDQGERRNVMKVATTSSFRGWPAKRVPRGHHL